MKKVSRGAGRMEKPEITIGLDLGDRSLLQNSTVRLI
jgi:hypothetical protein